MFYFKFFYLIIIGFSLISCNTDNLFKAPPYAFEKWDRSNTIFLEKKKVMTECGYPNPAGEGFNAKPNEIAVMHLCMEQHGFKYTGNLGRYCDRHPTLPACIEAAAAKKAGG